MLLGSKSASAPDFKTIVGAKRPRQSDGGEAGLSGQKGIKRKVED
jgi:hypothetical protein